MVIRELRRLIATALLALAQRLTPRRDTETHSAIWHVAKAMRRTQG
jgi:hypothetical protein